MTQPTEITQEQIWDECLDRIESVVDEWASQCNITGRMGAKWDDADLVFCENVEIT